MLSNAIDFRWRARFWHLTYKHHIPPETLLAALSAAGGGSLRVLGSSIVHEQSDAQVPYDHTHVAWMWEGAPNLRGSHLFDVSFEGARIHPHAVNKKSLQWMKNLFTRYHLGHKLDSYGKPAFVPPVAGPWQELPPTLDWDELVLTEVSRAADLIEGAQLAGVTIRSMHDVLLVQKSKRPLPFEHNFARDTFLKLDLPQAFLCREVGTLQIYGARNLGKTKWALSQFFNPLYVTNRNVLLEFQAGVHDGIVFDKMRPCDVFSLHECEDWTDYMQPAALKCLYHIARLPKRLPKIIVTNERNVWPLDPMGILVGRRIVQLEITAKTFAQP